MKFEFTSLIFYGNDTMCQRQMGLDVALCLSTSKPLVLLIALCSSFALPNAISASSRKITQPASPSPPPHLRQHSTGRHHPLGEKMGKYNIGFCLSTQRWANHSKTQHWADLYHP